MTTGMGLRDDAPAEVVELVAPVARLVQPGRAARHRRRRPVLLLRGELKASRPGCLGRGSRSMCWATLAPGGEDHAGTAARVLGAREHGKEALPELALIRRARTAAPPQPRLDWPLASPRTDLAALFGARRFGYLPTATSPSGMEEASLSLDIASLSPRRRCAREPSRSAKTPVPCRESRGDAHSLRWPLVRTVQRRGRFVPRTAGATKTPGSSWWQKLGPGGSADFRHHRSQGASRGNDRRPGRHRDRLQGLGHRPTGRGQPRLAAHGRCLGGPGAVPGLVQVSV